jgi:hypothetical protein
MSYLKTFLKNKNLYLNSLEHCLQCLMSVFEYLILIRYISNHATYKKLLWVFLNDLHHLIHFFTLKHKKLSIGYICFGSF